MFAWRVIPTSGTGMIFAFLVVRQAYGSALLPPMFIVLSFAWGMAVFLVVQAAMYAWNNKALDPAIFNRMKNLLGLFVVSSLYLVAAYHMTNLYFAKQTGFELFILRDGGIYPMLFWAGYVLLGSLLPLALVYLPGLANTNCSHCITAGDTGQLRLALCLHPRRTSLPAVYIPWLRS
jgi:molybdopterin-containing oxidoreductase family membrane subunit